MRIGADLTNNDVQAMMSPKQYAQYEALSMRYAFSQFGLPLPSAMVTAKGDCIMIVKFPSRTDVPLEKWKVIEMELNTEKVKKKIDSKLGLDKPQTTRTSVSHFQCPSLFGTHEELKRRTSVLRLYNNGKNDKNDFEEIKEVMTTAVNDMLEAAAKDHNLEQLCDGLVVAGGEFCQKPDKGDELLGKVLGQHVPIFTANEAHDEVSIFDIFETPDDSVRSTSSVKKPRRHSMPKLKLSLRNLDLRSPELQHCITSELDLINDKEKMSQALVQVLKAHARSLVLKDLFSTPGIGAGAEGARAQPGPEGLVRAASYPAALPAKVRLPRAASYPEKLTTKGSPFKKRSIIFSKLWRFENQFEAFPTNWVSGWYLQSMKDTGSLYDSETCLIFDFGSSEGKSILCTFSDGCISSSELCKYERLEDFVLEKDGKTKDEMLREIIRQAQEVSASIIVIGTTAWHRESEEIWRETNRFLRDVRKELKKTKIKLVMNLPEEDDYTTKPKVSGGNDVTTQKTAEAAKCASRGIPFSSDIVDDKAYLLSCPHVDNKRWIESVPSKPPNNRRMFILDAPKKTFGNKTGDFQPVSMHIVEDHCSLECTTKATGDHLVHIIGGKGKTYHNGEVLAKGAKKQLAPLDRVVVGDILLMFHDPAAEDTLKRMEKTSEALLEVGRATWKELQKEVTLRSNSTPVEIIRFALFLTRCPKPIEALSMSRKETAESKKHKLVEDACDEHRGIIAKQSPLLTKLTPMEGTDEARYETRSTMYAADAADFESAVVVTHGSGGGSTQISIIDGERSAVVATIAEELGTRIGTSLIQNFLAENQSSSNCQSELNDDENPTELEKQIKIEATKKMLEKAVEEWRNDIQRKMGKWTLQGYDQKEPTPMHVKDLTQEKSKNKLIIGISAVYYGFKESPRFLTSKPLEEIPHEDVIKSFQDKLKYLINATRTEKNMRICKEFSKDHKPMSFDKWIQEIANVTYQIEVLSTLYHSSSKFYFAREWQVQKSPFRTTWSTGWFIEYLRYRQVLRFGRIALVVRMEEQTTCFIWREFEKDEVEVPTEILQDSDKTHGEFRQVEQYFRHGEERELIAKIQSIQRSIRADAVVVELGKTYWPDGEETHHSREHAIFARLNASVQRLNASVQGISRGKLR
jgi:hypothetical protein